MVTDISLGLPMRKSRFPLPTIIRRFHRGNSGRNRHFYGSLHVPADVNIAGDAKGIIEGPQPVKNRAKPFLPRELASEAWHGASSSGKRMPPVFHRETIRYGNETLPDLEDW